MRRPVISVTFPGGVKKASELYEALDQIEMEAKRIAKADPAISVDDFKKKLDIFCGFALPEISNIPTLPEYFKTYIAKQNWDYRTVQKFEGIKTKLEEFSSDQRYKLTFDNITQEWAKHFTLWMEANGVASPNTQSKIFQVIKQVMSDAAEQTIVIDGELVPYHSNKHFKKFSTKRVDTTKHFLTLGELEKLWSYDLSSDKSKEVVRDYFLIMCYTGLRISDVLSLDKTNFFKDVDGSEFIRLYTFKGRNVKKDNEVVIPVLPELKKIMDKYEYVLPEPLSERKHNEYIKQIVKAAGIERIEQHKTSDKKGTTTTVDIHEKISNHSGRYTFINFMLNDYSINPHELMKITGQSLKVLMGYERGKKEENAKKVLQKIKPRFDIIRNIG